jgi:HlyD family secretion protein
MRKWALRAAILLALAAAIVALRFTAFAPEPIPVLAVAAAAGLVEEAVTNSRAGTVRARRRAKISPEIGGQVAALPFAEGSSVQAGDLVLQLVDRSQRAQLDLSREEAAAARAELDRACLTAEHAEREAARLRRLAAEDIIPSDLLDAADSEGRAAAAVCEAARAGVARAQAAIRLAETELEKTRLSTPFAGVVAEITTEVGEWVTPSPPALPVPPVVDILDPRSIYISAPMDEVDAARLRSGLPARVSVDSHRDQRFAGTVARVAPYVLDVEEQNRTVEIEVALADAQFAATLLPGTSADVEVILESRPQVLRIPTAALMQDNRVLVVEGDRLAERKLTIGLRNWDYVEVRDGLAAGDQVVTSLDREEVKARARVEVVEELPEGS